jgi:hypothetical protein
MTGKIQYDFKSNGTDKTQHWVLSFKNVFSLIKGLYVAYKKRPDAIHIFPDKTASIQAIKNNTKEEQYANTSLQPVGD